MAGLLTDEEVLAKSASPLLSDDEVLAKTNPTPTENPPSWYDRLASGAVDIAKTIPSSFARASAGLVGIPQTAQKIIGKYDYSPVGLLENAALRGAEKISPSLANAPNLGDVSLSGLKQLMGGVYHEPETSAGKVADFAAQNVLFGAKNPRELLNVGKTVKSLITGTAAGTAGELIPDDMPRLKMAAQMIGGFTPTAVEHALTSPDRATKNAAKMIKQAMEGKTSSEWAAAEHLVGTEASKAGVPLMGPEGFKGGSQIQQLASDVAASPVAGAKVRSFVQDRPEQVQASVKQHLTNLGQNIGAREAANQAEIAATKVIQNAEKQQSKVVKPFYEAAKTEQVPEATVKGIVGRIDQAIAEDKTGILAPQLTALRKTLIEEPGKASTLPSREAKQTLRGQMYSTKPGTAATPTKYVTDVENLDRARKYFRDKIDLPEFSAEALPKEVSATITPLLNDIRSQMESSSKNYETGKSLYKTIQAQKIDPLLKGPVGNIAGKGADAQKEAVYTRVMAELGSDTATPKRIATVADELGKVDKTAFPNVVRAYLEGKLNHSLKDLQGRKNPMSGANFRNAIEGTPNERDNVRAMIQKVAETQGQDGAKVYQGFGKLLDVLEATGRVPGMGSQTQSRMESAAIARENPLAGAVEVVSTNPTKRISKWIDDMYYKKTYSKLADVFTSPDSIKQMRQLADMKPNSIEARGLVSLMLTSATQRSNKTDNSQDDSKR